jgi:hypothetical protein
MVWRKVVKQLSQYFAEKQQMVSGYPGNQRF